MASSWATNQKARQANSSISAWSSGDDVATGAGLPGQEGLSRFLDVGPRRPSCGRRPAVIDSRRDLVLAGFQAHYVAGPVFDMDGGGHVVHGTEVSVPALGRSAASGRSTSRLGDSDSQLDPRSEPQLAGMWMGCPSVTTRRSSPIPIGTPMPSSSVNVQPSWSRSTRRREPCRVR